MKITVSRVHYGGRGAQQVTPANGSLALYKIGYYERNRRVMPTY